jgi:molecular chaperone GrpE
MIKSKQPTTAPTQELEKKLKALTEALEQAQAHQLRAEEAEKRAKADYQNLVRRNQEERTQFVKFATKELMSDLLQPLDHLSMAAAQLNDTGLNMVIDQLWQRLQQHGLQAIDPVGQPFDVATMEAVEGKTEENNTSDNQPAEKMVVGKVVTKGYILNGEVIQFARVILK